MEENVKKDKKENFIRIASKRTEKVLQRIEQLQNCANKNNYEYSEEQLEKIFSEIDEVLEKCKEAFRSKTKDKRKTFELSSVLPGQISLDETE